MNFADFSNEFMLQLIAANTKEEITKLLEDAGFEFTQEEVETIYANVTGERSGISILSDDEMDAVAGGDMYDIPCTKSTETPPKHRWRKFTRNFDPNDYFYLCMNCGTRYWTKEMPAP